MKPTPKGWPRISSSLYYEDASKAIDFLCRAFGFELRLKIEGDAGRIEHSELVFGDAVVMVGSADHPDKAKYRRAPTQAGGANTQNMMVYVDDVEAHCRQAQAAGATIVEPPTTHDYGDDYWADRSYGALDPEGHLWWVTQRLRNPPAAAR